MQEFPVDPTIILDHNYLATPQNLKVSGLTTQQKPKSTKLLFETAFYLVCLRSPKQHIEFHALVKKH